MTTPIVDDDGEQSRAGNLLDEGDLPGALRALDASLEGIAYRLDRKYTRNLVVIVVFGVLACIAIGVAASSAMSSRSAHGDLAAYKQATKEARIGSCEQQRKSALNAIDAADDHDATLADIFVPPPRSTTVQHEIDVNLAKLHASSVRKNPLRDCTARGIESFLSGRGGYEAPTTTEKP